MRLVDTSAWIELLRRPQGLSLDDLRGSGEILTCLPVIQEVLQGIRDERAFTDIRDAMLALPRVDDPLGLDVVERAIQIYRQTRRLGLTVRSSIDCLVAASALAFDLTVVHCDRDYDAIAHVTGLRHENLGRRLARRR
ncbi:MAG: PIN domain-containing protein [Vicinamibacterales bacterium]